MKKQKVNLKKLEVKSFVTDEQELNKRTVKGGGFLSLFGNTCNGSCSCSCDCTQGELSCNYTCTCETCNCPTDNNCLSTDPADTVCVCQ